MADPAISTVPPVGKSSPPRSCRSVVLPDPEAPTMAILSPARTLMDAPRNTRIFASPWTNSLARSFPSSTTAFEFGIIVPSSIVSQRFCGQQAGGAHRRIQGGEAGEHEGETANAHHVRRPHAGRQVAHEVHAGVQELESDDAFEPVYQILQVHGDGDAQQHADADSQQSDQAALHHEYRQDAAG